MYAFEMNYPFIKWVGGKRSVLPELMSRLPSTFNQYWEPFVGGGALYFALSEQLQTRKANAYLSDMNEDLILAYRAVQQHLPALIVLLQAHETAHALDQKTYYYQTRAHVPKDPIERAARFIYLNRTCFNGLWRVNQKGLFNVPMGAYKTPGIANKQTLQQASAALTGCHIAYQPYQDIKPLPHDLVYFDPPYDPLTKTASFTAYSKDKFGDEAQIKLKEKMDELTKQGVNVMLSNSNTPFIRSLYANYTIEVIRVGRAIAASTASRKPVEEVIVRNYQ